METLQTIETKIDKLIEQNKKDIETTEAELVKANQAISDAQAKLVQAQKEINSEKYVEAKGDLWTAERTKEFHEGRLKELSEKVGVSNVNLSKMKTGKISAIRFSTLEAICEVLNCQPGDILEYVKDDEKS